MEGEVLIGRVIKSQSGHVFVDTDRGRVHCSLRGRLKRERKARTDLAVVGDRVSVRLKEEDGEGVIEAIEPRQNRFARRQPGKRGVFKEDVIVANLDRLFAVFSCSRPPMNPRLVDRFLVVAELDRITPVLIANKLDEVDRAEAERAFGLYERIGYRVLYTSALRGDGIDALREELRGRLSAFIGPSGVGKSSLLNAVEPDLAASVGDISETLDKGRHTTRVAELHPLSFGGWVADTPGIRELASFDLPKAELDTCFPEMRPFLGECRFPDCTHDHEPGCAVREAAQRGDIAPERYDNYLRILGGEER